MTRRRIFIFMMYLHYNNIFYYIYNNSLKKKPIINNETDIYKHFKKYIIDIVKNKYPQKRRRKYSFEYY